MVLYQEIMQRRVEMSTLLLVSNGKVRLVATQTISLVMDEVLETWTWKISCQLYTYFWALLVTDRILTRLKETIRSDGYLFEYM
jgi:hypothetical protein